MRMMMMMMMMMIIIIIIIIIIINDWFFDWLRWDSLFGTSVAIGPIVPAPDDGWAWSSV
jgi:hypothetical protein